MSFQFVIFSMKVPKQKQRKCCLKQNTLSD